MQFGNATRVLDPRLLDHDCAPLRRLPANHDSDMDIGDGYEFWQPGRIATPIESLLSHGPSKQVLIPHYRFKTGNLVLQRYLSPEAMLATWKQACGRLV